MWLTTNKEIFHKTSFNNCIFYDIIVIKWETNIVFTSFFHYDEIIKIFENNLLLKK